MSRRSLNLPTFCWDFDFVRVFGGGDNLSSPSPGFLAVEKEKKRLLAGK